jgi:hypothetical protein
MLDFNFEEKLKKFVLENKPAGSLDIHISCTVSGMINITDDSCEDSDQYYQDTIEELKEQIEDLEDTITILRAYSSKSDD